MSTEYQLHENVAVLSLNNPPVNGLGLETRTPLNAGLMRAWNDPAVVAIVIAAMGKVFCGGADIREFGLPHALAEPNLLTLIDRVEASAKPVVMALHGMCMGGGTELSLGAHYRVVLRGTQIGLPEVKIGLVPGGGGTQRLPRAIGLVPALEMIVSGNPQAAEHLAAIPGQRLIDLLVESDLLAAAVAFAQSKVGAVLPKLAGCPVHVDGDADAVLQAARAKLTPQFPAQAACIDCVEAALRQSFDTGIQFERATFARLLESAESRALRHVFFAERAAAKISDVPENAAIRKVRSIGVIGAGTMGGGIAMIFLNVGLPVVIVEADAQALERGIAVIAKNYQSQVHKGKLSEVQLGERMGLLKPSMDFSALSDCDLIIEAVFEDMGVKESVFRKLDAIAKPGAILASNTSTLNLDQIAAFTQRPSDVIGLHFFSPANIMRLLEVVRGKHTSVEVLATAMALAKKIKKLAVVSGVCDGFIGNRMVEQYSRQAGFLLEEGALPAQVDAAIEAFGFAMGPFRMSDLAGNDIGWAIRKRRYVEQPELSYPAVFDRVCELGRFGQKTGAGWYDYQPGDRTAHPSSLVNELVLQVSQERGLTRREISDVEIVERLVYALVNEGAHILEEGIASKASDIDMVYVSGYGFPPYRGGPMYYAHEVGIMNVLAAMQRFAEMDAENRQAGAWRPAKSLLVQ